MIFYSSLKTVFVAHTFSDLKGLKFFFFLLYYFDLFFFLGSSFVETIEKGVFWLDVTDYDQDNLETLAKVELLFILF